MQFLKKVQSDKGLNLKNIEMESFRTRIAYHLSHLRESLSDSLKSVRVWFFLLIVLMAWIPCTVMTAYVMDQMKRTTTRIRNIKKYMLACLFNAPTTISSFYQQEVNADFPQYARQ